MQKVILPPKTPRWQAGHYSQGVKVKPGVLVFLSGQVPEDAQGNLVGKGNMEAQARQVMENVKAMVEEAGGTLDNVVKLTAYLTDMTQREAVSKVRDEYFKRDFPASTFVEVKSLVNKDWLLEIEAIAVVPE